jgi:hypothetical protein
MEVGGKLVVEIVEHGDVLGKSIEGPVAARFRNSADVPEDCRTGVVGESDEKVLWFGGEIVPEVLLPERASLVFGFEDARVGGLPEDRFRAKPQRFFPLTGLVAGELVDAEDSDICHRSTT